LILKVRAVTNILVAGNVVKQSVPDVSYSVWSCTGKTSSCLGNVEQWRFWVAETACVAAVGHGGSSVDEW